MPPAADEDGAAQPAPPSDRRSAVTRTALPPARRSPEPPQKPADLPAPWRLRRHTPETVRAQLSAATGIRSRFTCQLVADPSSCPRLHPRCRPQNRTRWQQPLRHLHRTLAWICPGAPTDAPPQNPNRRPCPPARRSPGGADRRSAVTRTVTVPERAGRLNPNRLTRTG